jgi:hypothetical protein
MFLRVVDTLVTKEIVPDSTCPYKLEPKIENDEKNSRPNRELLSATEQSEYDVLYGGKLR